MKLTTAEQPVDTHNMEISGFQIAHSAKMFKLLSDRLYSNKIEACVRELSTNAWDAHTLSGKSNIPFEVHLPTWSNKTFYIRDFGDGMSPEKINDVFKVYGMSDKDDTNELIGCQGLGSKTPFCYHTKTYIVECWHDGVHYTYSCFYNEQQLPVLSLMNTVQSDEPSGTKVSFATKSEDMYSFRSIAKKVFKYFSVLPTMVGEDTQLKYQEYDLEGISWKLRKHDGERCKAIMGNVAYPIDSSFDENLTSVQRNILRSDFDLHLNIGELDITPSREGLSYDNRTKLHLRSILNKVSQEMANIFSNKISTQPSKWQARCEFHNLLSHIPLEVHKSVDFDNIKWQNELLFDGADYTIKLDKLHKGCGFTFTHYKYNRYNRKVSEHVVTKLQPYKDMLFFINDLKIGYKSRCKLKVQTDCKDVYIVNVPSNMHQKLYDVLGMVNGDHKIIKPVSELTSISVRKANLTRNRTASTMLFNKSGTKPTQYWKNQEIDLTNGGVYVEWKRFKWLCNQVWQDGDQLITILSNLEAVNISLPIIYGFKPTLVKEVKKLSNWITVEQYVKQQLKSLKKYNYLQVILDNSSIHKCESNYNKHIPSYYILKFVKDHSIKIDDFIQKYTKAQINSKTIGTARAFSCLHRMFNISSTMLVVDHKLYTQLIDIHKTFPLLAEVNMCKNNEYVVKHLCKYVSLIEGEKNVSK